MYISKVKTDDELLGLGIELYEEFKFSIEPCHADRCSSFATTSGEGIVYITPESKSGRFRAGSYSGHNKFRDILSKAMHGITADQFWTDMNWDEHDFGALIDFSDCQGVMCYSVANKLYKSFKKNRKKFKSYIRDYEIGDDVMEIDYLMATYDDWTKAMKIASDNGIIIFC